MKTIKWNIEKEAKLQSLKERGGISFTDCVIAIDDGRVLDILPHPQKDHQKLLVLNIEDYAYVVPFVTEEDGSLFLKTVYPSRQHTARYLTKKEP